MEGGSAVIRVKARLGAPSHTPSFDTEETYTVRPDGGSTPPFRFAPCAGKSLRPCPASASCWISTGGSTLPNGSGGARMKTTRI